VESGLASGASDNDRRATCYLCTRIGDKEFDAEQREWHCSPAAVNRIMRRARRTPTAASTRSIDMLWSYSGYERCRREADS
jgi:hypothetical protein